MQEQLRQKAVINNMAFSEGLEASYRTPGLEDVEQKRIAHQKAEERVASHVRRFRPIYEARWLEGYNSPRPTDEILTY